MAVFKVDWSRGFKKYEASSVEVKVTPEVLVKQAEEVRKLGNDMKRRFREIEKVIERTQGYWISDAGELHRKLYEEQKENIGLILERLLEHSEDLLLISENYKAAERTNLETVTALDPNIIS